jgi:hypothetical protein
VGVQIKSLDKKLYKDGIDSPAAVASPRAHHCSSPTQMSNASTACSPEPEAKAAPATTVLTEPVGFATAPALDEEDVKVASSLSLQVLGSGIPQQLDAGLVQNVEWQPETPATTLAAHGAGKCNWPSEQETSLTANIDAHAAQAAEENADLVVLVEEASQVADDADLMDDMAGMSNEELIAQLAGCAAALAKPCLAACMPQATTDCALESFQGFDNVMCHEDALQTLLFEAPDDEDQHRLWGQDLLGLC